MTYLDIMILGNISKFLKAHEFYIFRASMPAYWSNIDLRDFLIFFKIRVPRIISLMDYPQDSRSAFYYIKLIKTKKDKDVPWSVLRFLNSKHAFLATIIIGKRIPVLENRIMKIPANYEAYKKMFLMNHSRCPGLTRSRRMFRGAILPRFRNEDHRLL